MKGLAVGMVVVALGACGGAEDVEDTGVGLRVTAAGSAVLSLAAIEGSVPIAVGVTLERRPNDPVVITLSADPLVTLDRTSLTFTAADFDRPQPVVITPADDDDLLDDAGELVLAASATDQLVIPIAVADDDRVWLVTPPDPVAVVEGGSASFGIALGFDPGGPITVTVGSSDPAKATVQPATLTFGAGWATPQTVTVTALADADDLDEALAVELAGLHVTPTSVPVDVLDDERQNLVIAPTTLALTEGGAAQTFTVRLTQPPAGPLEVAVASVNPYLAAVSPPTLTFTAADYATPQVVTVAPQADIDGLLDFSTVRLTASDLRDRVVTVAVAEDAVADLPDIDGDFLLAIRPSYSGGDVIRYRATFTGDPVTAQIILRAVALRVDDDQPIGDTLEAADVVRDDATFPQAFSALLPGPANPFTGTDALFGVDAPGRVVGADFLCGTMTPQLGDLIDFGTTWGAVRITGSTLPAPIAACP